MKLHNLQDLLVDQLKDLYSAEKQITKALPKMAKAAAHPELKAAFEQHLEQTKRHVERLEEVFDLFDAAPRSKTCKAIQGLIEEGQELMSERADEAVMDAGLIAAAQKVEHYEIASYGCARTWARQVGNEQAARLLQQTLEEEGQTDEKLTRLAESMVNREAAVGSRR
jgi:ferritin-like metal-binding protein YciE